MLGIGRQLQQPPQQTSRHHHWSYQWYTPGGPLNYLEVADQLLDVYLKGLEPRDSARGD